MLFKISPHEPIHLQYGSSQDLVPLFLAVAMVKCTPEGLSILDNLTLILWNRGLARNDATKPGQQISLHDPPDESILAPETSSLESNRFTPERTESPPPGQPAYLSGSRQEVNHDGWEQRISQLEIENDALRRWKLDHQLDLDRLRIQSPSELDSVVKKCRRARKTKRNIQRAKDIAIVELLPDNQENRSPSATIGKDQGQSNILRGLETLRRHRFFAKLGSQQNIFCIEASMWNTAMTTSIIEITEEITQLLIAPTTNLHVSQKIYSHAIITVREHVTTSFLTFYQYSKVLEALEASWRLLLESTLACSGSKAVDPSPLQIAVTTCMIANCQVDCGYSGTATLRAHYSGSLLLVILRILVEHLELIIQQGDHRQPTVTKQSHNTTRSSFKAVTKARLLDAQSSLESRSRQEQVEKNCSWISEVADVVCSSYQLHKGHCVHHESREASYEHLFYFQKLEDDLASIIRRVTSCVLFCPSRGSGEIFSVWFTERMTEFLVGIDTFGFFGES